MPGARGWPWRLLLAAVVVAGVVDVSDTAPVPDRLVRWSGLPAPASLPYPVDAPPPAITAPPCGASDISLELGKTTAISGGGHAQLVRFVNRSPRPCSLSGYPDADATAGGEVVAEVHPSIRSDPWPPRDLPPGGFAIEVLRGGGRCQGSGRQPAVMSDHVVFHLGDGDVDVPMSMGADCGITVTRFGSTTLDPGMRPPYELLEADIHLPETVRPGEVLRFVISLTNPTGDTISLAPALCPAWRYDLVKDGDYVVLNGFDPAGGLDCRAVGSIAPGETVRYEMRIPVPDVEPGPMSVGWFFLPLGDGAHGKVLVR